MTKCITVMGERLKGSDHELPVARLHELLRDINPSPGDHSPALEIDGYVTLPLEFVNRRSVACSWIVACALA